MTREQMIDSAVRAQHKYGRNWGRTYSLITAVRDHPRIQAQTLWDAFPGSVKWVRREFARLVDVA